MKDEKKLYRVRNYNICSDGTPYDIYVWAYKEPTLKDLQPLLEEEIADMADWTDAEEIYDEFMTSSEIDEMCLYDLEDYK